MSRLVTQNAVKQTLLLNNLLKTQAPKELGLQYKQQILKNMLLKINKLKDLQSKRNPFASEIKRQTINKGSDLQSANDLAMFNHQIFKFNKALETNTVVLDRQVSGLLEKYLTVSLSLKSKTKGKQGHIAGITDKNTVNPIYLSSPVFKHSTSKVEISFFYYHNTTYKNGNKYYNDFAKYYVPVINKLMASMSDNTNYNSLAFILEQYYNKKVVFKPKKLKYIYNNNEIFTQYVSKQVKNDARFASRLARVLQKIMPQISDETAAIKYNLRLISMTEAKVNRIVAEHRNSLGNLDITKLYKDTKYQETAKTLLMFKYLLGAQITFKGRSMRKAAIARSQKSKVFRGTFRNKVYYYNVLSNQYKLNQHKSNISAHQSDKVTKYGKFNIAIKSNYL